MTNFTRVFYKWTEKGRWREAMLGEDIHGTAVLQIGLKSLGPSEVHSVGVLPDCPVEILDVAVESGFFVIGQARSK